MPARGIPTLVVESDAGGLLLFNMTPAGEIGPGRPAALPVCDGTHALHLMPLEAGRLPLTCRVRFEDGRACPPEDASGRIVLRAWPGGVCEAALRPERIREPVRLPLSPASASRTAFTSGGKRLSAEWAGFGDWWLVIEDDGGTPLLTHAVPNASGPGPIAAVPMDGRLLVVARAAGDEGRSLVIAAGQSEGRWQVLFEDAGDTVETGGGAVTVTRDLRDAAGHTRRRSWRPGSPPEDRYAAALPFPDEPSQTARAFLEALALGLDGEAAGLLSPALAEGLPIGEVRNFIGEIREILPCRYGPPPPEPGWAVARPSAPGLLEVSAFRFHMSGGRIDNIVPG